MFREELGKTLGEFFARSAPGQPQATPLTMRLTGLALAETRGFAPTVTARMEAEFYLRRPDSSYALVARFARTAQQPLTGGPGATLVYHAANLGALLLSAAAAGGDPAAWSAAGLSYAAVPGVGVGITAGPAAPFAILAPATQLRPGFYYSLADFTSNQPSEPGPPEVESRPYFGTEWAGEFELKPYHQVNGRRVLATNIWGFCDGEHAYIRWGPDFYRLRQREGTFNFFGRTGQGPATSLFALAALASRGGGVVGNSAEHRVLYQLDIATGVVSLSPSLGVAVGVTHERPAQVFVYRPRSAKGPAVRIQLADGQPARELAAGDYLNFSPPADQLLHLTLLPADGPAVELPILPTGRAALYLECQPTEATPLRQVQNAAGAAAVTRLLK